MLVSQRWLPVVCLILALLAAPVRAEDNAAEAKASAAKVDDPAKAKAAEIARQESLTDYEFFQVLADTVDQVERNYVEEVSRKELLEAAINGILTKLDPHSNYISSEEISRFKTSVEQEFGGIGIQVSMERGQLKILSPLVGTPAYRAGLLSGDAIVEIEGKSTEGITIDEAIRRLKGEIGTSVTMSVIHPGTNDKQTVTLTRELVHLETVMGDHRKDDDSWDFMLDPEKGIGYIRITAFSRDTAEDVKKAVQSLQSQGLKGLIVDLRFNPGGLLHSVIEISDMFLASGRIVSTQGRNTQERSWDAQEDGTFDNFPMAVLVNRYSASASEIFSACLQDHKRAVIIGERTFGKGSVQNVIDLDGGKSALKRTTASYKRPNGHNIHRFPNAKESDEWGVTPDKDFELKLSDGEMFQLVQNRRERDILVRKAPKSDAPAASEKTPGADKTPDGPDKTDAKADKPSESGDKQAEDDAPPSETKRDANESSEKQHKFVDRQLQKAIDYLSQRLAEAK
jgi:carboxyl-terminal processing protease